MTASATLTPSELRTLVFGARDVELVQVAYTVADTARAFGKPEQVVLRLVSAGRMPSRNTGRAYLIPGGVILDVLGSAHPDINDHRDVIDRAAAYTYAEVGTLLGISIHAAKRLAASRRLTPDRTAPRPLFSGALLLDYLGGTDEPLRHRDSA